MKRFVSHKQMYNILRAAIFILYSGWRNIRSGWWNVCSGWRNIRFASRNVKLIRLFREINAACGVNMSVLFTINWKLNANFTYR